ncbi:MAG: PEPxxWA-CTERM sorting domain-containing protein [Sphingobium sp.]|nr:PEPxxWA-CTERM sorting domain-containing protein [Sphingobium sp.]
MLYGGAAALLAVVSVSASAAPLVSAPLPGNAYITFGGLDWAWASPCSPTGCSNGADPLDLSFQGAFGWRLPTAAEFAARPQASDFAFRGANVPFGGADANGTTFPGAIPTDGACAAAYFTAGAFNHCDYNDGNIGAIFGNPVYAGVANVETWLVRGGVPEAGTWAMMIAGLGLTGLAMRRRKIAVRFA